MCIFTDTGNVSKLLSSEVFAFYFGISVFCYFNFPYPSSTFQGKCIFNILCVFSYFADTVCCISAKVAYF